MTITPQRPDIFNYHDYGLFLNDWVSFLKGGKQKFSLRKLSSRVGISPAYFSLILSGQRHLTVGAAQKMSIHLQLKPTEQKYFRLLVKLSESKDQSDREEAYRQIKRFSQYKEKNQKEVEVHRYASRWYYVAIREMAAHPKFTGDVKWIQKRLIKHVPASEIQVALDFLTANKFIQKNADGSFSLPQKNVECMGGIFQLSMNQFHQQALEMASQAIDTVSKDRRHLTGYTFMMSQDSYLKVVEALNEAQTKIQAIEQNDLKKQGEKSVYHVELVAIPFTRGEK